MNWRPNNVTAKTAEGPKNPKPCPMGQEQKIAVECDQVALLPRLQEGASCYQDGKCMPRELFPVEAAKLGTKAACH